MHRLIQSVQNSYEKIAEHFSDTRIYPWAEFALFEPYLQKKMNILDVACGNGRLLTFLDLYIGNYLGTDLSDNLLNEARKRHPDFSFVQHDMSLPFDTITDQCFDAIFCIAAFHHLPNTKLRRQTLENWFSVLQSGGVVCLTVWNLWQKKYWKQYLCAKYFGFLTKWGYKGIPIPWKNQDKIVQTKRYYYAFDPSELIRLCKQVGFQIECFYYVKKGKIVKERWNAYNMLVVLRKN